MVPFGGWEMPVQYAEGILAEHRHTREAASLFDICHMGEFRVEGPGAAKALDGVLARAVADQAVGSCRYNFLLADDGGVLDDLVVYRLGDEEFYIVVNAGTRLGDARRIAALLPAGVSFADESDATGKLDLQGPRSASVLATLGLPSAKLPGYYKWIKTELAGIPMLLSRTGYTGELGFELYVDAARVGDLWDLLLAHGEVKPVGLGARDTLRLEMGYPLYGHELNPATTPIEAGFGPLLKLGSGRAFAGGQALAARAPAKRLVGIALDGRRSARADFPVLSTDKVVIGKVTSGAFAPSLDRAVAMAYVDAAAALELGDKVLVDAGRAALEGVVTSLPFHPGGTARIKL